MIVEWVVAIKEACRATMATVKVKCQCNQETIIQDKATRIKQRSTVVLAIRTAVIAEAPTQVQATIITEVAEEDTIAVVHQTTIKVVAFETITTAHATINSSPLNELTIIIQIMRTTINNLKWLKLLLPLGRIHITFEIFL
jgi:hypothetical protein